jgi:hypothetical protein
MFVRWRLGGDYVKIRGRLMWQKKTAGLSLPFLRASTAASFGLIRQSEQEL